jgi:hypothetical protein
MLVPMLVVTAPETEPCPATGLGAGIAATVLDARPDCVVVVIGPDAGFDKTTLAATVTGFEVGLLLGLPMFCYSKR